MMCFRRHRFSQRNLATHFVADNLTLFDIEQGGHGEAPLIFGIDVEVDIAQMGEVFVNRIRGHVVARQLLVGLCKSPSCIRDGYIWLRSNR